MFIDQGYHHLKEEIKILFKKFFVEGKLKFVCYTKENQDKKKKIFLGKK